MGDIEAESRFYLGFNRVHVYIIIGACFVISCVFFYDASMSFPQWPTLIFLVFCGWTATDQWNEAIKRKGKGLTTDLELSRGGHVCIHPEDYRMAARYDEEGNMIMSFACIAGGGYLFMGTVGFHGTDFFLVVPPEHIINSESGMMITTHLTRRDWDELPRYMQSGLLKLPRFSVTLAKAKKNIYFGMTSKFDCTETSQNLATEDRFCMMNKQISDMKKMIDDSSARLERLRYEQQPAPQIIVQQPAPRVIEQQ